MQGAREVTPSLNVTATSEGDTERVRQTRLRDEFFLLASGENSKRRETSRG
jgi:hypothetical protein